MLEGRIRLTSGRPVVMVPGLGGSGADHWQTRWEDRNPGFRRISPHTWDPPQLADGLAALRDAIGDHPALLVAHSLGCLLAVEWARRNPASTAGLFLVAAPDPAGARFPLPRSPFTSIDLDTPLGCPALIVASDDDPYCDPSRSAQIATGIGAGWLSLGALGHLNADSRLGCWPNGQALLVAFDAGLTAETARHG